MNINEIKITSLVSIAVGVAIGLVYYYFGFLWALLVIFVALVVKWGIRLFLILTGVKSEKHPSTPPQKF
jgi:hypothetical protein